MQLYTVPHPMLLPTSSQKHRSHLQQHSAGRSAKRHKFVLLGVEVGKDSPCGALDLPARCMKPNCSINSWRGRSGTYQALVAVPAEQSRRKH